VGTPYLSEVKIIPWNYPPKGWAFCNGQFLPINQNQALFSLLGTTYGGNGQTTFALPNLQGRAPIHVGAGFTQGQAGGEAAHTVTVSEMPAHTHLLNVQPGSGNATTGSGNFLANAGSDLFTAPTAFVAMNPAAVTNTGGSQPHNNMQPYLVVNYIIALQGVFPSRN
jgi:microcystin-dependent protein